MCGIVAYIGNKDAYPILINGLKRLEYRGYDSAGVALLNTNNELNVYRLQEIVRDCYEYDIEDYKTQYENVFQDTIDRCRKKKVIIHRSSKGLIRANALMKELRWKFLDEAYNQNLSIGENHQILNDSGFIISIPTLYNYCRNRGIVKRKKSENKFIRFMELHKDYMSCRKEQQYLAENGLQLSLGAIQTYRKRLEMDIS